ncbi:MAG: ABC transporter substrate-binding protein, partial [Thermomicrobiales bacterium]|nr:ABC transporter substrate-binding protein [Thermomicrobiales bacterium]
MPDDLDDAIRMPDNSTSPGLAADTFSRRTLMASVVGGVSAVALASRFAGRLRKPSPAQQSPGASPVAASPVAGTPSATASATATATVTPSPTPVPDPFGDIEVVRGERFEYADGPRSSETLTLFVQGAASNLDFSPASYVQDTQIITAYLDPLVGIDAVTMEPVPWLAEKWVWGDGNQTVTFTLREDVRWHDDRPLTADDVAFSFTVYRDDIDSAVRNFFTTMEAAEALDDRTVKVTLSTPDGNWILNASSLPIFSRRQYREYWESQPEGARSLTGFDWNDNSPVGSGPWKIDAQDSNAITLRSWEDYWQNPPAFEELIFRFSESQEERVARWIEGEGDLLWPVSLADVPNLKDTEARLFAAPGAQVAFAAFNFENWGREQFPQLLSDANVRQALNLAIDREKYADETYLGLIHQTAAGTVAQPWANDP